MLASSILPFFFGPQFFLQDLLEPLLKFFFREDPHFLVDHAQDGGPGEVPVQVLGGRLGGVQGQRA